MPRLSSVTKILLLLRSSGGAVNRKTVTLALAGHIKAAELDHLLTHDLAGLVEARLERIQTTGRTPVRWALTSAGWAVANTIVADGSPLVLDQAEVICQRMLYRHAGKAQRQLARRFLVLLGQLSELKAYDAQKRAEAKAKKPKRRSKPMDAAAIRRINRARDRKGMEPMRGVETPAEIPAYIQPYIQQEAEDAPEVPPAPIQGVVPPWERSTSTFRPATANRPSGLLPNLCRHPRGRPDGSCYGHCQSPLYQPL